MLWANTTVLPKTERLSTGRGESAVPGSLVTFGVVRPAGAGGMMLGSSSRRPPGPRSS